MKTVSPIKFRSSFTPRELRSGHETSGSRLPLPLMKTIQTGTGTAKRDQKSLLLPSLVMLRCGSYAIVPPQIDLIIGIGACP